MSKKNKKITKPIYAFIDSQNLNLSIRSQGWKLDFKRFRVYLKDKYKVEKAFLFIGYIPGNQILYTYLQESDYIVVFKPTLEYKKDDKRYTKGNVDADLVLHTMIQYPNYNKAIIVSGDGDFHCLIEYLKKKNKLSHIIIPNPKKYSALLRKFRKYFVYINDLKKKLSTKKRGSNLRTRP
ncbi:NYN domain-containing protein [Patescibacteria group bacterium]|nr:NYN domain-containing protein [Patescibacteria group bacterium]